MLTGEQRIQLYNLKEEFNSLPDYEKDVQLDFYIIKAMNIIEEKEE